MVDSIVKTDWYIAAIAIADNLSGKQIKQAQNEMAKAADELARGNLVSAIEQYRNAWNHAIKS